MKEDFIEDKIAKLVECILWIFFKMAANIGLSKVFILDKYFKEVGSTFQLVLEDFDCRKSYEKLFFITKYKILKSFLLDKRLKFLKLQIFLLSKSASKVLGN